MQNDVSYKQMNKYSYIIIKLLNLKENKMEDNKYLVIDSSNLEKLLENMPIEEDIYDLADLFKMFSDSTRLKILCVLAEGEMCVNDIAGIISMSQSAVSHQLRVLKQSKLIKGRREGKIVFYSLADKHINIIINNGFEHIQE